MFWTQPQIYVFKIVYVCEDKYSAYLFIGIVLFGNLHLCTEKAVYLNG